MEQHQSDINYQQQEVAVTQHQNTQNKVDRQDQAICKETKCSLLKPSSTLQYNTAFLTSQNDRTTGADPH